MKPAIDKKEEIDGSLKLVMETGTDGKVTTASAAGLDTAVDACVADAIKAAVFPAPTAPTTVTYPLTFKPST